MAKLDNSKRRLPQATYAQVRIRDGEATFRPHRPLLKTALVLAGRPSLAEADAVRTQITQEIATGGANTAALQAQLQAVEAISVLINSPGSPDLERVAPAMAQVDSEALASLSERLVRMREERVTAVIANHKRLLEAYERSSKEAKPPDKTDTPTGFSPVGSQSFQRVSGGLFRREEKLEGAPPRPGSPPGGKLRPGLAQGERRRTETVFIAPKSADSGARALPSAVASPSLRQLVDWANDSGQLAAEAKEIAALTGKFRYVPENLMAADVEKALHTQIEHSHKVIEAFRKQAEVEPVGFLHLERLTFAPDGIERGELVYSVPMAPGEEVNLAHKEWAATTEEFEKIVTDSLEEYSEEGVTDTSELAQSTSSQNQHSMGLNTSVTASGSYGPVSVSSSVSLNLQTSATTTAEFSRNQSISLTRKASSRSKKEHKISFKVVTSGGSEDQTVRKIKNPLPDQAARLDYYQLIRKWEVNVYRYGIRLTYDITIPEPGADVLTKIQEINDLNAALQQGFGSSDSKLPWARFDITPGQIKRSNYAALAAQYSAAVPAPPLEHKDYDQVMTHDWKTKEEAEGLEFHVMELAVDDGYEIDYVGVDTDYTHYEDEPWQFGVQSHDDFFGVTGKRQLVYWTKFLGAAFVEVRLGAKLTDAAFREWQLKAWGAMRDAAQSRYYETRLMLKDQLAKLQEELSGQDALSLRKFEREEIMKGVLRWLFGPDFEFVPAGMPADMYDGGESVKTNKIWKETLRHGELIKFLHHAVEWENVLYVLYPYFWSHLSRWELKKYLNHPDPLHRAFLKAGSARVVLTIRPGFERDFVSLIETGSFKGLPATHPYMTIIEEMEAFARTNYPGIPPANPEGAGTTEEGLLIGTWHEYTPTSALDVAFGETLPTA